MASGTIQRGVTVYRTRVHGTTDSTGVLSTGIVAANYTIIACLAYRGQSGSYTGFYNLAVSGISSNSADATWSVTAFQNNANATALANQLIYFDVYYIENNSVEVT